MMCEPYPFPGASYKIIEKSNHLLLVFAEGRYQLVLLAPCHIVAEGTDLQQMQEVWLNVRNFLSALPESIAENPPELFKAYVEFYHSHEEIFSSILCPSSITPGGDDRTDFPLQPKDLYLHLADDGYEEPPTESLSLAECAELPDTPPLAPPLQTPSPPLHSAPAVPESQPVPSEPATPSEKERDESNFALIKEHIFSDQLSLEGIAEIVSQLPAESRHQLLQETNARQETILHKAVTKRNLECVRSFIEMGVNVNARDSNGWTPLHSACDEHLMDIATVLIKNGAHVMALTLTRTIPLHYYVRMVTEETWQDDQKILELMMQEGVDINAQDSHGQTPLYRVLVRGRNLNCVEYLLTHNASPDIGTTGGDYMTPLHVAAIHGSVPLIKMLLAHKGNPGLSCRRGNAIDVAREHGHSVIVELIRDSQIAIRKRSMSISASGSRSFQRPSPTNDDLARASSTTTLAENTPKPPPSEERPMGPAPGNYLPAGWTPLKPSQTRQSVHGPSRPRPPQPTGTESPPLRANSTPRCKVPDAALPISAVDKRRQSFGVQSEGQHLETYTCKMNGTSGMLHIWPRCCTFESLQEKRAKIIFLDVVALKKFVITSGIELVVHDAKRGKRYVSFTSLSASDDEVYNLLHFLIQIRKKPDPIRIEGVPLHLMLGTIKYPEKTREFRTRFSHHSDPTDTLVMSFTITACMRNKVKVSSAQGQLYLTHRRIGYYSESSKRRTILLIRLNSVLSVTTRGQGIVVVFTSQSAKEMWYFSFGSSEAKSRAHTMIERQWKTELQNSVENKVGVLGANTFLGQEVAGHFLSIDKKFRCILIESPPGALDHLLVPIQDAEQCSTLDSVSAEDVFQVKFEDRDALSQLKNALEGVSRLFVILEINGFLKNIRLLAELIQKREIVLQKILIVLFDVPEATSSSDLVREQHSQTESLIKSLGIDYSIFRVGVPMQFLPICVLPSPRIFTLPLFSGAIDWIDLQDVARAVLTALFDDSALYTDTVLHLRTPNWLTLPKLLEVLKASLTYPLHPVTSLDECTMILENSIIPTELLPSVLEFLHSLQSSDRPSDPTLQERFAINPKSLEIYVREHENEFTTSCLMYFPEKERQMHATVFQTLTALPSKTSISMEEFQGHRGQNSLLLQQGLCNGLFRAFDIRSEKQLDLPQYLHGLSVLLKGTEGEQIDFAFRMFDNRRKGYLSPQDLKAFVETYQALLPRDEKEKITRFTRSLLTLMDPKSSGRISYATFMNVCLRNYQFIASLGQYDLSKPSVLGRNRANVRGLPIGFHHEQWELVWFVMHGITQSVRACEERSVRGSMDEEDMFTQVEKYTFPEQANTPNDSNKGANNRANSVWSFIDVAPSVFRLIRDRFGIRTHDYLSALGTDDLLGHLLLGRLRTLRTMSSSGRSGSIFYVSPDNRFFIKTIPEEEDATFCRILRDYYVHLRENPNTLVTRFYGLHRIRENNGPWMSFVVMGNLFHDPTLPVHEIYDLKGSTVNRHVEIKEDQDRSTVALKDNDFNHVLDLGPALRAFLFQQVERDARWMEKRNICDYSLLVGIHFRTQGEALSDSQWENSASSEQHLNTILEETRDVDGALLHNLFSNFHNGILSTDKTMVYYIGIIDTLTEFNLKKWGEVVAKSFFHQVSEISANPPKRYRRRYQKYVISIVK